MKIILSLDDAEYLLPFRGAPVNYWCDQPEEATNSPTTLYDVLIMSKPTCNSKLHIGLFKVQGSVFFFFYD